MKRIFHLILLLAIATLGMAATEFEPASGSTVHALDSIRISFDDYNVVATASYKPMLTVYKDGKKSNCFIYSWSQVKINGNRVSLPLSMFVKDEGNYSVTFPEGYFLLGEQKEKSQELTYTFSVEKMPRKTYLTLPENGRVVNSIQQFSLVFSDVESVEKSNVAPVIYRQENEDDKWISYMRLKSSDCAISGKTATFTLSEKEIVGPGIYHIVIPDRTLTFNGNSCEYLVADTLTLKIEGEARLVFTPNDGSEVDYLSDFSFVYGGNISYCVARHDDLDVLDSKGNVVAHAYASGINDNAPMCKIRLKQAIHTPGTYTIQIPDSLYDYNFHAAKVIAGQVTYTVTGKTLATNVQFFPSQGANIMNADTVTVVFPDYETVKYNGTAIYSNVNNCQKVKYMLSDWGVVVQGNVVKFPVSQLMTESGEYLYHFPAGTFLLGPGETPSTPLNLVLQVEEHKSPVVESDIKPESYMTSFDAITLTFPEHTSVNYFQNDNCPTLYKQNLSDEGEAIWSYVGNYRPYVWSGNLFSVDGNVWKMIPANSVKDEGYYKFTIPAGFLYFEGDKNNFNGEINILFHIGSDPTGIAEVVTNENREGKNEKYDLLGRKITSVQKNQIYISNGKKYIKTK